MQVRTADETIEFSPSDPPVVKDGAVVGGLHMTYSVDPQDIVELSPEKKAARIVLKDGTRFLVASSVADGERILCEAVKPVSIPLDEIVRAQVRTVNTGASVFNTFAGVLLAAGAVALDIALNPDDGEFDLADSFTGELIVSLVESAPEFIAEADGPARPTRPSWA